MLSTQTTAAKQHEVVDQCIHKWGARFAFAPGNNSEIAKAVVYRCSDAIFDYYQLVAREPNSLSDAEKQASDEEFSEMALMRVIQQRAGQCPLESRK
jgi:hypothetical protein